MPTSKNKTSDKVFPSIKAIAFDLDDTLLDTSGLLVPQAARQACQKLLDAGLKCDLQTCLDYRAKKALHMSHTEIFPEIAQQFGPLPAQDVQKAVDAFYIPQLPDSLPIFNGALENLQKLHPHYILYVVTMGHKATQLQKIKSLGIGPFFKNIYVLDNVKKERKETAFLEILRQENITPPELLSFGNRLSAEIRDAKKIGATACHFIYGEHADEKPSSIFDAPDVTITNHSEFISACQLLD
jgi:putative hydrolase of the HAD superfamily